MSGPPLQAQLAALSVAEMAEIRRAPPFAVIISVPKMLFHSQLFLLIFLPLALAGYYLAAGSGARRGAVRQWWLLLASLTFYGYWDVRFLPLLIGSVCLNWLFAKLFVAKTPARLFIPAGVALNLLVLGIFKYANFFGAILADIGLVAPQTWSIVLPLGISFFTFQQISYLVDRSRGTAPAYGFREYAAYVCFFPQLIAGPIVRHDELIGQFAADPRRDGLHERMVRGAVLLTIGLIKKLVFADTLARIADPLYQAAEAGKSLALGESWLAAGAFGLQIYFDFSAYSDMAIGIALMFGFLLPMNFNAPYRADSIREFWRRWHMTLSRFLRDYLYIPLGGSRHGEVRLMAAVMGTMLLGGLWHGAGWTFVAWGGIHGIALAINNYWNQYLKPLPKPFGWIFTLLVVYFAWVLFRAESFAGAASIMAGMVGANGLALAADAAGKAWIIPLAALVSVVGPSSQQAALEDLEPNSAWTLASALAFAYAVIAAGGGLGQEFIYFQF